ncbi:sugar phosphate isomerase/epimerase family protein [Nakamurella lactea]|uniref:sugar phosphate isomerase/epimerase family protein n=1 Tax=Nakamurella lactea TaxID=459515 RepID=UPI000426F86D|nr:sugar phosphate isomerase/epimerase family protein [Nakamurella lactea]
MTGSPIGCHALVWTGDFDAAGITSSIDRTKAAGFDLIEFPLMEPESFDSTVARRALQDAGLSATASLGLPEHADVSSDDPEVVAAGAKLLRTALERTAEMGGTVLCGVLYGSMRKHLAPMSDRGRANSIEAIHRLADQAQALGVRLSLEVVNRYESNLLNTGRDALRFLTGVDHPSVSVHLDTYHMNIEESDLFQPFLDTGERLGYVHIGESHRGYLGTGSVDFDSAFRALDRIGYTGPIVFESFSSAVVSATLSNTLGIWRNLWTDSDDLGAHANRFIRDHIAAVRTIELH